MRLPRTCLCTAVSDDADRRREREAQRRRGGKRQRRPAAHSVERRDDQGRDARDEPDGSGDDLRRSGCTRTRQASGPARGEPLPAAACGANPSLNQVNAHISSHDFPPISIGRPTTRRARIRAVSRSPVARHALYHSDRREPFSVRPPKRAKVWSRWPIDRQSRTISLSVCPIGGTTDEHKSAARERLAIATASTSSDC